ncbi:MAG: hypothetical protein IJT20_02050 [Synergistaceae bacterium]|nr:hypothetical protein [Synergistaceae bacterium]
MQSAIKNPEKLVEVINDFVAVMLFKDGGRPLSFVDKNNFLANTKDGEAYKSEIAVLAGRKLKYDEWQEEWINTWKISERCKEAMNCAGNLVHYIQQSKFADVLTPGHEKFNPEAERVLYEIYKSRPGNEEREAFENARKIFGSIYEVISYLFFIKDSSRFVHLRSGIFEERLSLVGIEYKLLFKCSWENYIGFIGIMKEIRNIMQRIIPDVEIRLIDAHSFLWIIGWEEFKEWNKEHK